MSRTGQAQATSMSFTSRDLSRVLSVVLSAENSGTSHSFATPCLFFWDLCFWCSANGRINWKYHGEIYASENLFIWSMSDLNISPSFVIYGSRKVAVKIQIDALTLSWLNEMTWISSDWRGRRCLLNAQLHQSPSRASVDDVLLGVPLNELVEDKMETSLASTRLNYWCGLSIGISSQNKRKAKLSWSQSLRALNRSKSSLICRISLLHH